VLVFNFIWGLPVNLGGAVFFLVAGFFQTCEF
jgi:hypothetical protein